MNCNDAERAIIEQHVPTAKVTDHVETCPACQRFARFYRRLLANAPETTPAKAVDRAVLDAARQHLATRTLSSLPHVFGRIILAAAALIVVATLGVALLRPSQPVNVVTFVPEADPPALQLSLWTSTVLGLEFMDSQLDTAMEELSTEPAVSGARETNGVDGVETYDPLLELEFDVYFESQRLRMDG